MVRSTEVFGIGLGVRDHQLDLAAVEDAARIVRLLDRELHALDALLTEHLEAARERLQNAELDDLLRPDDRRKAERGDRRGRAGALQHRAAGGSTSDDLSDATPLTLLSLSLLHLFFRPRVRDW